MMKVLQLDVKSIEYELIEPELRVYEKSDDKDVKVEDAVVLLVSVEQGDTQNVAKKAIDEAVAFATKQKVPNLVLYPFAHLSEDLEAPQKAMELFAGMVKEAEKSGLKVVHAPFGWNKAWHIMIKGHPLAEQSRKYSEGADEKKRAKPVRRDVDLSIVKKSDWSGLPAADHRTIGEQNNLYSFQEVSPAMVYWHPNGWIVFKELVRFIREMEDRYEYEEISTPAIANVALWHVSGHIDHYRDNMFSFESGSDTFGLKPMNCPSTMLIYKSRKWSYRELPFRTAIFDRLYRREVSGALSGLFRVQEMTQDDGHIFVTENQLSDELASLMKFVKEAYDTFGLKFTAKLSTMPEDHMGDKALWDKATAALEDALKANKIAYEVKEGEGAFYGPKIDYDVFDSAGRAWQCATIQLDYQLPVKFELTYTGEDGKQYMPVVIHRAVLGTLERFTAVMTEHFQGKFPTWLAPSQARVLSISEQAADYAEKVYRELKKYGIRVKLDASDKTLDYKIRDAQMQRVPYILVVGKKEAENGTIAVRSRNGTQKFGVKVDEFAETLLKEIRERSLKLSY
jgi:threonyl-tRNA synthetase